MKELSIEEKAKRYDEVREKIAIRFGSNVVKEIFSEYEDSEDERISKAIIKGLSSCGNKYWGGFEVKVALDWVKKQAENASFLNKIQIGDKVTRNEYGALVNLSQLKRVAKKGENQCQIVTKKDIDDAYLKGICDAKHELEKQNKYKPAWSEEDENYKDALIGLINEIKSQPLKRLEDWDSYLNWIKSLKDRIQPERKWSAEDSRILYNVKAYIGYAAGQRGVRDELFKEANEWLNSLPIGFIYNKNYNEDMITLLVGELKQIASDNNAPEQYQVEINWLKSLRPQKQWKPSDEQMNALSVINVTGGISYAGQGQELMNLYNDLKKLREE